MFTDITSRKKAEEDLRHSEEKFAKAFRSSPDAVSITTLKEGRFLDVNEGFLKITGYSRSEVIDHTSIELGIWPSPEFRQDIRDQVSAKGGISNLEVEFRIKSASSGRSSMPPSPSTSRACHASYPSSPMSRNSAGLSARSWMWANASARR